MKKIIELQKNQIAIESDTNYEFYSYGTLIAISEKWWETYLTDKWNYSKTTTKWLCEFFRQIIWIETNSKEIRKDLEKWLIKLLDNNQ